MKKLLIVLVVLVALGAWFWIRATQAVPVNEIKDDQIYVFIQKGCPHCLAAEKYLKDKYSHVRMQLLDISKERNRMMFFGCGAKFGLKKMQMGTPLFCMGSRYILGWDKAAEAEFDTYVKDFLPDQ